MRIAKFCEKNVRVTGSSETIAILEREHKEDVEVWVDSLSFNRKWGHY